MKREPVESSNIRAIGYDPGTQVLKVEFKKGPIYSYSGVTEGVYQALKDASSKGKFLRSDIVGNFPSSKED